MSGIGRQTGPLHRPHTKRYIGGSFMSKPILDKKKILAVEIVFLIKTDANKRDTAVSADLPP
jgi:hypothetical protein